MQSRILEDSQDKLLMVTTEDDDDDENNDNKVKKRSIKHSHLLSVEEQEVIAGLNPARIAKC